MTDPLARLTPLAVMVLALLDEGDMHPYEMMRLMRQRRDDRLVAITNGTMYHTVGRLERAGLVTEVGVDRDGGRPERTTYAVTAAGRDTVREWVRRELPRVDRPAEFRIALAEAHNLPRADVLDLLRTRRAALDDAARSLRDGHREAGVRGIPEQFLIEVEREQTLLAAELRWMDTLLARLDAHEFPWGTRELSGHSPHYLNDRKAARL